jgi:hypothetical protein
MLTPKNNRACQGDKQCGFTKFEFAISCVLVCILAAVLLDRLAMYRDETERAQVERVVGALRAALQFKAGELMVLSRHSDADKFLEQNPMDWLVEKPKNYLGEYYFAKPEVLQKGNWYFDRSNKTLVYLLNNGKSFESGQSNLLKFKVKFSTTPRTPVTLNGPPTVIKGVVLDQVFDHDRT